MDGLAHSRNPLMVCGDFICKILNNPYLKKCSKTVQFSQLSDQHPLINFSMKLYKSWNYLTHFCRKLGTLINTSCLATVVMRFRSGSQWPVVFKLCIALNISFYLCYMSSVCFDLNFIKLRNEI